MADGLRIDQLVDDRFLHERVVTVQIGLLVEDLLYLAGHMLEYGLVGFTGISAVLLDAVLIACIDAAASVAELEYLA